MIFDSFFVASQMRILNTYAFTQLICTISREVISNDSVLVTGDRSRMISRFSAASWLQRSPFTEAEDPRT